MSTNVIGFLRTEDLQRRSGSVNAQNPFDSYLFVIEDTPLDLTLSLTGMAQDADLYLFQDTNGNGVLDLGTDLQVSRSSRPGSTDDSIALQLLAPGNYLAVVSRFQQNSTSYQLDIETTLDRPGILTPTELYIGDLSSTPQTFVGNLRRNNTLDTLGFTMADDGNFNAVLTRIEDGSDIDLRLIRDNNGNGIVDESEGEIVAVSITDGNAPEILNVRSLAAGDYILQAYIYEGFSDYNLTLSNSGSEPSNLVFGTEGNAGVLGFSPTRFRGTLQRNDASDIYFFTMGSRGNFNASLTGIAVGSDVDMRLINDTNNNGIVDDTDQIVATSVAGSNRDEAINIRNLSAGNYFLQTYHYSGRGSRYTLDLSNTGSSGFSPSNLLPTEVEVGILNASLFSTSGSLSRTDAADTYRFTMLRNGNFGAALTNILPGTDIDMRLIRDFNNNGVVDEEDGEVGIVSQAAGNRNEGIFIQSLAAGNYILQTYLFSGRPSTYNLSLVNTGNNPSPLVPVERAAGGLRYRPYVSFDSLDSQDFSDAYSFFMDSTGNFNASLTDIEFGADIDMRLIQDVNGNGIIDGSDQILAVSAAGSNRDEAINIQSLAAGSYILQTYLYDGGPSGYTLRLSNTGQDPSNLLPVERDVRVLGSEPFVWTTSIGPRDAADTYRFTMFGAGNFNAALTGIAPGTDIDMRLIQDVNGNGIVDGSDNVVAIAQASGNRNDTINVQSLAGGEYILQTYLYSGGTSNYTVAMSNTGTDPSNLIPIERNFGSVGATPLVARDVLRRQDAADTFQFTMETTGNFNALLTDITFGTDIDMRLIADITNNGIVDEGDRVVAVSQADGSRDESINIRSLNSGNYILQTYLFSGNGSTYSLGVSNTGNDGESPSNLLGVEANAGVVGDPLTRFDSVSVTDATDTFRFVVASTDTVTLSLTGLQADADLRLIRDFNNNGIVDAGEELRRSARGGTLSEVISGQLAPGAYFAQVYLYPNNGSTSYALTIG